MESAFEGARKITSEEYQAGERFAVQRHEDNLKLGTEVREYDQKSKDFDMFEEDFDLHSV